MGDIMGRDEGNSSRARERHVGEVKKARIKSLRGGREQRRDWSQYRGRSMKVLGVERSPLARESQESEVWRYRRMPRWKGIVNSA